MYKALFAEVNLICILFLAFILFHERRNVNRPMQSVYFMRILSSTILCLALDFIWILLDGRDHPLLIWPNNLVNALFLSMCGVVSYYWYMYVESWLELLRNVGKVEKVLRLLPLGILIFMSFSSPWTHWLFTVNESNIYSRGPFHIVQVIVSYLYMLCATVRLLYRLRVEKDRQIRQSIWSLCGFIVPISIAGVLSAFYFGMPAVWPATALSILFVYINTLGAQISTDGLTMLNNRRQFDRYLNALLSESHHGGVYLLLMDIDAFKNVNDTYGHLEGDLALKQAAAILKDVCRTRECFLARYGGDEFAIVCRGESDVQARECAEAVRDGLRAYNEERIDRKYTLWLSIGFGACEPGETIDADQLIARADESLYHAKPGGSPARSAG